MKLGEKILKLRKKLGLSQEQLGELIEVTRQTISNWELGETSPNPEQLKLLSGVFNVSIDELLDNDIKSTLEKKSNTEKLAGIIIKILKVVGIIFLILLIIDIFSLIFFSVYRVHLEQNVTEGIEIQCSINDDDYLISVGSDGYFNCSNCSEKLQNELKNHYIDFGDISQTEENIIHYFKDKKGDCEFITSG